MQFNQLFRWYTLPMYDHDGRLTYRRATRVEVARYHAAVHTITVSINDGNGNTVPTPEAVSCHAAEVERQELIRTTAGQDELIGNLQDQINGLEADVANAQRLMLGSMQVVFHMGPALRTLLAEELESPTLTDDQSAVKIEHVLFTVIINPFQERVTVRDVAGNVPERSFSVVNGRISEDDQTLLLGHIGRIKTAAGNGGTDPVAGTIGLVTPAVVTV